MIKYPNYINNRTINKAINKNYFFYFQKNILNN